MSLPSVAVVILNFNGKAHLERFLPSVVATRYPQLEIVIADNGSSDGSVAFLQKHYPVLTLLLHATNEGFAGGYNRALQLVKADYYVLLNSDVEVSPNWIVPVIDLMESDKSVGACQPKILCHADPDYLEYAGGAGGWIDVLGYPFSRGRLFDVLEKDNGQYDNPEPIFWASGAAMFIRSELYHRAHGFDAGFFAHQEEIDLCWRIQLMGYKIMACPQSEVFHVGAGTLPRGGRKVYLNFRNNLSMLYKNLDTKTALWVFACRYFLDTVSAMKGLLHGDFEFFKAISRAHCSFYRQIVSGKLKRNKNGRPLCLLQGVYPGSIVWQHFIKGKKYFSEVVSPFRNGNPL